MKPRLVALALVLNLTLASVDLKPESVDSKAVSADGKNGTPDAGNTPDADQDDNVPKLKPATIGQALIGAFLGATVGVVVGESMMMASYAEADGGDHFMHGFGGAAGGAYVALRLSDKAVREYLDDAGVDIPETKPLIAISSRERMPLSNRFSASAAFAGVVAGSLVMPISTLSSQPGGSSASSFASSSNDVAGRGRDGPPLVKSAAHLALLQCAITGALGGMSAAYFSPEIVQYGQMLAELIGQKLREARVASKTAVAVAARVYRAGKARAEDYVNKQLSPKEPAQSTDGSLQPSEVDGKGKIVATATGPSAMGSKETATDPSLKVSSSKDGTDPSIKGSSSKDAIGTDPTTKSPSHGTVEPREVGVMDTVMTTLSGMQDTAKKAVDAVLSGKVVERAVSTVDAAQTAGQKAMQDILTGGAPALVERGYNKAQAATRQLVDEVDGQARNALAKAAPAVESRLDALNDALDGPSMERQVRAAKKVLAENGVVLKDAEQAQSAQSVRHAHRKAPHVDAVHR